MLYVYSCFLHTNYFCSHIKNKGFFILIKCAILKKVACIYELINRFPENMLPDFLPCQSCFDYLGKAPVLQKKYLKLN